MFTTNQIVKVFRQPQKLVTVLTVFFVVILFLCRENHAVSTVKLVANPNNTVVPVGSGPIALTAQVSGSNLTFEWELFGPGDIETFATGSAVFYIPPEKIDSKSTRVIITLKVTDAKGQEVTESLIFTIVANDAEVPTITPTPSSAPTLRPITKKEDRLEQLKLEVCEKKTLPQLLKQTLCQHYEKYKDLKEKEQQGNSIEDQDILVFKDIVKNLKEVETCVETIIHKDPENSLKDFIPRLKKILDRSKELENDQQVFVLGDFTFTPPHSYCQPIAAIDKQLPVIDEAWKKTDAYKGPGTSSYETPTQVLVDEEDNLYVLDTTLKRIFKFDSKGNHLPSHFDEMTVEEQWVSTSMAMDHGGRGIFWVYDSWQGKKNISPPPSGRIRIYTKDGTQAVGWNEKKELTACEKVLFPLKGLIALDIENNLIIVDQESGIMTKCDRHGKFLNQWGEREKTPLLEEVMNPFEIVTDPQGLAVDTFGIIYVSNTAGHGIQQYYPDGEWIPGWPNVRGKNLYFFDSPHGLAVDEKCYVYVSDTKNHRVKKYTSGGEKLLWVLGKGNAQKGKKNGEFNNPMAVAVNSDGTIIYVADTGNKRVQKFLIQK